jgi:hypothetical protein
MLCIERFGLGSFEVIDVDCIVEEKEEEFDDVFLDSLKKIEGNDIVVGSGDDGLEFVVWCGDVSLEDVKKKFVEYEENEYGSGDDVSKWFDMVMEEKGSNVRLF